MGIRSRFRGLSPQKGLNPTGVFFPYFEFWLDSHCFSFRPYWLTLRSGIVIIYLDRFYSVLPHNYG